MKYTRYQSLSAFFLFESGVDCIYSSGVSFLYYPDVMTSTLFGTAKSLNCHFLQPASIFGIATAGRGLPKYKRTTFEDVNKLKNALMFDS